TILSESAEERRNRRAAINPRRTTMKARIDIGAVSPAAYRAMLGLEKFIHESSIEPKLAHLLKMRASQINGCAYCLDMHSKDARARGETEQRLYGLDAWRETPYYTERERAALQWTEAVTLVSQTHVPDDAFEVVKEQFSDEEIMNLTLAIVAIN